MLEPSDLMAYFTQHGIPDAAKRMIVLIRESDPARVVGGRRNVTGRFPSKKMGCTIQFESHKNELAFVYEYEFDGDVLEYWDQPNTMKLEYQAASGRMVAALHTPDYFVIRRDGIAGWEECKMEDTLEKLAEDQPNRYIKDSDGNWRCPPGEEEAARFGLYYKVRSSMGVNWTLQRNLRFLEDYYRSGTVEVSDATRAVVKAVVAHCPGIKLSDLREKLADVTADEFFAMLLSRDIYSDLESMPLAEPDRVLVFIDRHTALRYEASFQKRSNPLAELRPVKVSNGEVVVWDGKTMFIELVGHDFVWLNDYNGRTTKLAPTEFESLIAKGYITGGGSGTDDEPAVIEKLRNADAEALAIANSRLEQISSFRAGDLTGLTERTRFRWESRFREAEMTLGSGFFGLIPNHSEKGNRSRKLPPLAIELVKKVINEDILTHKQKNRKAAHAVLEELCKEQNVICPSYKTFCEAINKIPPEEFTFKRQGRRAAYTLQPFYYELNFTTPRHGDRPFEIVHIDHTEMDIELVDSETGEVLGRPWLTLVVDANSRRILAFILSFEPPSYRSCMCALRELVKRHSRFPQTIVVDGGKEFKGIYFEALLARYECTKKTRPPAKGRYGSVLERLFGSINTQVLSNMLGNTQMTKNVRQVTKSVDPKRKAVWTLEKLQNVLGKWAFEVYDTTRHDTLGLSPRQQFLNGLERHGSRPRMIVPYEKSFIISTLPTTKKGTAMVHPSKGIKINNINYWTSGFRYAGVGKTSVPVRYDPFDLSIAYAWVEGKWQECISEYEAFFKGRTEKELQVITEQLKKRKKVTKENESITAKKIVEFLTELQKDEEILIQQKRAAEVKKLLKDQPQDCRTSEPYERGEHSDGQDDLVSDGDSPQEYIDYGEM